MYGDVEFIIDSGATHHIINKNILFNQRPVFNKYLSTASKKLRIEATGDIKLLTIGHLRDVLYVPGATKNLLSVRKLTDDGQEIIFKKSEVYLKLRTGTLVLLGSLSDNLYVLRPEFAFGLNSEVVTGDADEAPLNDASTLETEEPQTEDPVYMLDMTSPSTLELLHRRFGHASIDKIKQLIRLELATGLHINPNTVRTRYHCTHCAQAKGTQHKLKFPKFDSKMINNRKYSDLSFGMVYTDVMGPFPTSITKHKYVVTFTELHSRYRWIFLLKQKSDAFGAFKMLCAEVKAHGFNLTMLKSDNGGEFVNEAWEKYCIDNNIIHRTTPPYTPNGNAYAKRALIGY